MSRSLAVSREIIDAQGNGVRVEFQKQGDRRSHTIFGVTNGEARPLLKSIEGTRDDFAPPSPPFTELHEQDGTIFLTGATTRAHWSMTVSAVDSSLVFDVACRMKAELAQVGSDYSVLDASFRAELELSTSDGTSFELVSDKVSVDAVSQMPTDFPATLQWRYTVARKAK